MDQQPHSYSKIIIGSLIVVALIGVGAAGAFFMKSKNSDRNRNNGQAGRQEKDNGRAISNGSQTASNSSRTHQFVDDYKDKCQEKSSVAFTSAPLALNELNYFDPMGRMNDGHVTPTDHVYVYPTNPNATDNTYNVLMPADGIVVDISKMGQQQVGDAHSGTKTISEDHRIVVAHSCQYFSIFIHVHELSPALKKVVGELNWNEQKQVNITLKAGEPIGKIGGSPVDWTLLDTTKTLTGFITPANYASEPWKIHTIDPLSVYTGDLKTQLIAKSLRSVEPYGGKIDYDKAGALIGTWFKEGTNGYAGASMERYWDGHLSVVPDAVDTTTTIVSIGNWDGQAKQYAVKGKVDPSTITASSGPVKYELMKIVNMTADGKPWNGYQQMQKGIKISQQEAVVGTIMFEVEAGEKLKVEKFIGKMASDVSGFTSAAMTYER